MTDLDEQARVVRGEGKRENGGAHIDIRDGRVNGFLAILSSLTPMAIMGIGVWIGSSLISIKESLATIGATMTTQTSAINARLDDKDFKDREHDGRLNQLDRDVSTLNGRNLRGGPAYERR